MPLMTPAAVIGIHIICTAQIVTPSGAEQHEVDDEHQADALPREARVDVALDPVVGRAVAVLVDRLGVLRLGAIELGAAQQDACSMPRVCGLCGSSTVSTLAWCLRWMATHSLVTMPVVSQSQKRKKCADSGCRSSAAVRLAAVQVDRHRGDRDVRQRQRDDDVSPPRQRHQTVRGKGKQIVTSLIIHV